MNRHDWKYKGKCLDYDVNLFFDKYEEDEQLRPAIDKLCASCPVARQCFAVGVSQKEWGVWGGVYLEGGSISRQFAKHRTKAQWAQTWQSLTIEKRDVDRSK
jgi:hypothetical protein